MNELSLFPQEFQPHEHFMSVKEVAEALGTADSTIRNIAKELFPEIIENGKASLFSEKQVYLIKNRIVPRDLTLKSKVESAVTSLDIAEMTLKVIVYHKAEADRLRSELAASSNALALAAPKVEMAEALMRCDRNMCITDACKHFGLHPKTEVFPYLRHHGYLTIRDLPTQAAIDAGYLALRQTKAQDGRIWPQAVVEVWQLETWRSRVVHQIKHWRQGASA